MSNFLEFKIVMILFSMVFCLKGFALTQTNTWGQLPGTGIPLTNISSTNRNFTTDLNLGSNTGSLCRMSTYIRFDNRVLNVQGVSRFLASDPFVYYSIAPSSSSVFCPNCNTDILIEWESITPSNPIDVESNLSELRISWRYVGNTPNEIIIINGRDNVMSYSHWQGSSCVFAGTSPGNLIQTISVGDSDGDLIADDVDNCTLRANGPNQLGNQIDTDVDGYGNACDPDYDNTGFVNTADFGIFLQSFGFSSSSSPPPVGGYNFETDHNGSLSTNVADYGIFLQFYSTPYPNNVPGPSGVAP